MRLLFTAFVLLLLLSGPLGAQTQNQFIVALTSVEGGGPIVGINASDLSVSESGQEIKVLKIEPVDWPVRVTLALENSRGLAADLVHVRNGAKGFIDALPPSVEVTLVSTAPQPRVVVKATKDHALLLKGVNSLAPEASSGRYVEALAEWVQRINKEKGSYTPVLVIFGSTIGEESIRENWANEALNLLPSLGAVIHGLMYNAPISATGSGGDVQMRIGQAASEQTKGRWEVFSASQRIASLLPEVGADVAKLATGGQFLVTVQRAPGATGRLGPLSLSPPDNVKVGKITRVEPKK